MKILLIGSAFLVPWMHYSRQALIRLHHQVVPFVSSHRLLDHVVPRQKSAGRRARWGKRLQAAWLRRRDQRLLELAAQVRPDLTLLLRGENFCAETLQALKAVTRRPLVTWWVDDPFRHSVQPLLPHYDVFFIFDRAYVEPLQKAGAHRVQFLPCACDETVYRPRRLSRAEQERYRSNIALVAWYYPNRAAVVRQLADLDLKIWGRGWKSPSAQRALNGTGRTLLLKEKFIRDEEVSKIYNAASIGLNIHSDQSRQAGLNARAFELLASGTFELTDYVAGMEELLLPGQEVAVYRSPQQARERADHYLRHPQERLELVRRGRQRVLREHTYVHRMQTLLQVGLS